MYSGGESTDSQKFAQWAMNPSSYQNLPNDQVDWAALAQQWIIMKEAGPPPIPGSQQRQPEKSPRIEEPEGGEAEMDMDTEKDEEPPIWNPRVPQEAPPAPGAEAWANWNPPPVTPSQSWSSWGQGAGAWTGPPPGVPPVKPPLLPTPNSLYSSMPPDGGSDNAVSFGGYNSGTPPQPQPTNFNTQPAFWTGMAVGKVTQTEIKPHNKRFSKVNVPTKVTIITPSANAAGSTPPVRPPVAAPPVLDLPVTPPPPTLDANKRKQLPAWIREGLEKMERDKQKQLEREKEKIARDEYEEKLKLEEKEKMELLKTTMKEKEMLLRKSRFDSDNELSEEEAEIVKKPISPPSPVPLTQEELMRKVRNTMTEVLLKVTTQLIEEICKEERQRYIKKKRASDQLSSAPSGALIKSKLGLDLYDEGSSSENQSDEEEEEHANGGESDSDAELREAIRRREAAYAKSDIKSTDEEKKERHHSSRSRSSSRENENHSQVEPNNAQETKSRASLDDNSSGSARPRRKSSTSSSSSRHRSRSRSSRRTNRYSKSPSRRRRSRSSSSRRGRESKRRHRRSRSDSSRHSRRSRRSRSRSSRRSKRSRRSRSRDRRRYDETSRSGKHNRRSRSRSYRKNRDRASRSSSRGKRSRRK